MEKKIKRLKSGEKIWRIEKWDDDEEYLIVQVWEHGPWCGDECLAEWGCSTMFTNDDVVGGTVREVFQRPEHFKMRYFDGKPLEIVKIEEGKNK